MQRECEKWSDFCFFFFLKIERNKKTAFHQLRGEGGGAFVWRRIRGLEFNAYANATAPRDENALHINLCRASVRVCHRAPAEIVTRTRDRIAQGPIDFTPPNEGLPPPLVFAAIQTDISY